MKITEEEFRDLHWSVRAKWGYWPVQKLHIPKVEEWCEENCEHKWLVKEASWAKNPNRKKEGEEGYRATADDVIYFENKKERSRITKDIGHIWEPWDSIIPIKPKGKK